MILHIIFFLKNVRQSRAHRPCNLTKQPNNKHIDRQWASGLATNLKVGLIHDLYFTKASSTFGPHHFSHHNPLGNGRSHVKW